MMGRQSSSRAGFGPAFPELGWAPAPRYLLRRGLVLSHLAGQPPGRVLEIGPGVGALLHELAAAGWSCTGVETSPQAFERAVRAASQTEGVALRTSLPEDGEAYDCLMAFEVLEHIEDDLGALRDWLTRIRPGGKVLLSVPAHERLWCASDVLAGHWRRYGRDQFARLATDAGCDVDSIESYGWPLGNLTAGVRAWVDARKLGSGPVADPSVEQRSEYTATSGIDRRWFARIYPLYANAAGAAAFKICLAIQRLALRTELGNGYLLTATKR